LAVGDVNDAGGIGGRQLELVIRDTAADPQRTTAAVDELARLGVAALAGEYHSVSARAAADRADALGAVEGTRGQIQFSHAPDISVWQWAWAPTRS
jgi:ABC-type branched-subunit amino acid transport system substrate-binding protein